MNCKQCGIELSGRCWVCSACKKIPKKERVPNAEPTEYGHRQAFMGDYGDELI